MSRYSSTLKSRNSVALNTLSYGIFLIMTPYIAALGRNTIDTYHTCPYGATLGEKVITSRGFTAFGGMVPNAICSLSALGFETVLFDTVGNDARSAAVVKELERQGVDTSCIHYANDCVIPDIQILLSKDGDNQSSTVIVAAGDDFPYRFDEKSLSCLKKADILYTTISALRSIESLNIIQFTKENNIRVVLDVEVSTFSSRTEDLVFFQEAYIIFFNHRGFKKFAQGDKDEDAIKRLTDRSEKIVVVTRGKNGCSTYTDNETVHIPGISVKFVDTTGAGDAFNAVFLWGILNGRLIEQAATEANLAAAQSTTVTGARSVLKFITNKQILL